MPPAPGNPVWLDPVLSLIAISSVKNVPVAESIKPKRKVSVAMLLLAVPVAKFTPSM